METHIRQNHGPLGALYPPKTSTAPGPHAAMKEGDTPSWLYFLDNGLNDPAHPEHGGWGGRFELDAKLSAGKSRIYRDARDTVGDETSARATVWRWRPAIAADFAMRLDWCVDKPVHAAPLIQVDTPMEKDATQISISPDKPARLQIRARNPADQSRLRVAWTLYTETATGGGIKASDGENNEVIVSAERGSEGLSVHMIVEGFDLANPNLRSYRRVIVTVEKR
jgi:hypothetical protein